MKKLFLLTLFMLFFHSITFSQSDICEATGNWEIKITNHASFHVFVQLFPISCVFNHDHIYTLISHDRSRGNNPGDKNHDYINGVHYVYNTNTPVLQNDIPPGGNCIGFDDDYQSITSTCGNISWGNYKLLIIRETEPDVYQVIDSVIIQNDYYSYNENFGDLYIDIYNYTNINNNHLYYNYLNQNVLAINCRSSNPDDYTIKLWWPNGIGNTTGHRPKGFGPVGGFEFRDVYSGSGISQSVFPLDCRVNCDITNNYVTPIFSVPQNQNVPLVDIGERQGIIPLDLTIRKRCHTPDNQTANVNYNLQISVEPGVTFTIGKNLTSNIPNESRGMFLNPYSLTSNGNDIIVKSGITEYPGYTIPGATMVLESSDLLSENSVLYVRNNCKVEVQSGANLNLGDFANIILEMYSSNSPNRGKLVLDNGSNTTFNHNSFITINNGGEFDLNSGSNVYCNANSNVYVNQGGIFCNQGAHFVGQLHVIYQGGPSHYSICDVVGTDNLLFGDSTNVKLESGAILDIPENKSLIIDGAGTSLQLDSNSTIVFGAGAKLIVRNGAKIKANYSNFIPTTNTAIWDGIYLEDCSVDTIQHCSINNAYSGINIINKYYSPNSLDCKVQVTNCTFNNYSIIQLLNGIYVENSNYFLLKDNVIQSISISDGFLNGITLNNCPAGYLDIINNNIANAEVGMTVVQSSPYVVRNTMSGLSNMGYGMYLDNSNGSIKFNTISDYSSDIITYYSNPYLFKNSLNSPDYANLELHSNSSPIMRPIVKNNTIHWLSGNNTFNGSPSTAAISFAENSFPVIDSGYNINQVTSTKFLSGEIPISLASVLYCRMNYWTGAVVPDNAQLDVTAGDCVFEPLYDRSPLPTPDSYEINRIGFGLNDTVALNDLSDTPDHDYYMQACDYEASGNYVEAINSYKNVITNYKNTFYALASLSRIFNCLEKNNSSLQAYTNHQSYLTQLRNNTTYPMAVRELCEDFIIKAKVRMGYIQDAVSDYNTIYLANQGNSKGLHALINKECLIAQLPDTSDGPVSHFNNKSGNKIKLFSLIGKKQITNILLNNTLPTHYSLSQNYPNPFNPVTKINYDLPKEGKVKLVIYDLLGREVKTLVNDFKQAGSYTIEFNASSFASGVYFYRIQVEGGKGFTAIKKMVLIK